MIITLTFELAEDVTPDYFARRVAEACFAYGALRKNEGVILPSDPTRVLLDGGKARRPSWLVRHQK